MEPGFLRSVWDVVASDQAQNFAQLVMALAVALTCLEFLYVRRKDRSDAAEKRKAAEEELKIKREEIDAALVEQYIGVLDDFIEHPELDRHDMPLENLQQAQQQRRIYEKLILLFATAFRRLDGEKDPELQEKWFDWQDDIDDWVALPNFRAAFEYLLTGEKQAFIDYMQKKRDEIPEAVGLVPVKRKRRAAQVVATAETGNSPHVTMN